MNENMTTEQFLLEVKQAIRTVMLGGQSYKIGSSRTDKSRPCAVESIKNRP